jgi:hypothetical protein
LSTLADRLLYYSGSEAFRISKRQRSSNSQSLSQTASSPLKRARPNSTEHSPVASPGDSSVLDICELSPQKKMVSVSRLPPIVPTFYTDSSEVARLQAFWEDYAALRATSEISMNRFQQQIYGPPSPPMISALCSQVCLLTVKYCLCNLPQKNRL